MAKKPTKFRFQFIQFREVEKKAKTEVYSCQNNRAVSEGLGREDAELGAVKWYPAWRQYCFFPTCQAIYSEGCLKDIAAFIEQMK